jgi:hypothetical protein
MITKELLHELFEYKDGELYWKVATTNRYGANRKAGFYCQNGYRYIGLMGKRYKTHRLIWMMHHGDMPEIIDHINRDSLDNRIENLRPATKAQNCQNNKKRINESGSRNVHQNKKTKKWTVRIAVNKKNIHIGSFEDFELAEFVAMEARNKYHKEFASHA